MIDFQLTEEQELMRQLAHRFAEREIRPVAAEYDKSEEMPWPVYGRFCPSWPARKPSVCTKRAPWIPALSLAARPSASCARSNRQPTSFRGWCRRRWRYESDGGSAGKGRQRCRHRGHATCRPGMGGPPA
ncbi:MAG: hypothetical protein DRI79_00595 [Chloroflexi bacterium]|nr:MAG: hypothetical protein DRI79_00595 [Chloroflexota bacterium]HEY67852.1 acyl-CoA dehydrogenase family protein [Thermoflexia bacterium]